ncbi:cytochrome P450 [Macrophomina phaseolina]|uniref:Cytochrome P450 n=1 Tax=Macrophomina phaseolina TaxID=35725 RepID=A0ABQ8GHN6_9PEZI|nr:cytochrome P450 [Macrophomina phaseolina]
MVRQEHFSLSALSISKVLAGILSTAVLYLVSRIIYNTYFHPLSSYPGPKLWAATRLPWNWTNLHGNLAWTILDLHTRYGPVVRIAPDELSYTTGSAWKKIYGQRTPAEFAKCLDGRGIAGPNMRTGGASGIVTAPHARHARLRRAILPAFSERALREQEHYLQLYTGKLVAQLRRRCRAGGGAAAPQDMQRWYGLLAFDVVSDLAFGQPAGCLENADQPWLQVIGARAKSIVWFQFAIYYGLDGWMDMLAPKSSIEARKKHLELTVAKVQQRLQQKEDRKDFMSYILDNKVETLSNKELVLMASSFIVAGSGTSSSALTGITFFLGRNPEKYRLLADEIRSAFSSEEEITIESTGRLSYLKAVIEEGMRLYPPSPSTLPRFVPGKGEEIDGKWVPGGTAVGVHQLSAGHMESNFRHAKSFIPERWLPLPNDSEFATDDRLAAQPYSYGPRNCIGQNLAYAEMKIVLAKLFWNFDFELADTTGRWLEEQKTYLVWDKTPMRVNLTLRT